MAEPICSAVSSFQQSVDIVHVDVSAFMLVCVGVRVCASMCTGACACICVCAYCINERILM